ncbi:MerR family transcriptional regulator [Lysinibacillus sp. S2017]|uniref:MerR family transcriptional regulator n=1 Tax=Lysinibacillus sp. S2017 TaxID=2561923 RepID=UPI00143E099A|nr:MerR family transcriptional regulator [Lysinibacillus sp. S2017]
MQYKNDEICKILKISSSTLRSYAKLFEGLDYEFKKAQNGHRIYQEDDLALLQTFIKNKKHNKKLTNLEVASDLLKIKTAKKNYYGASSQFEILLQLEQYVLIYQNELRDQNALFDIQLKNLQRKLDKLGVQQKIIVDYIESMNRASTDANKNGFIGLFKK